MRLLVYLNITSLNKLVFLRFSSAIASTFYIRFRLHFWFFFVRVVSVDQWRRHNFWKGDHKKNYISKLGGEEVGKSSILSKLFTKVIKIQWGDLTRSSPLVYAPERALCVMVELFTYLRPWYTYNNRESINT